MLFTHEAVSIIAAYRDNRATRQYAIFWRTDRDDDAPLIAIADVRGCETVVHELSDRGYEVDAIRIPFSQGSIYSVVARQLGVWAGDIIVQPIIWDRLAWHPEVADQAA
jgi:hypothetical protein